MRIGILDGFRALAIFFVILFHFFSRFAKPYYKEDLYPYASNYDYFRYGYLGVEFFFIISGFVIFFTLENTSNFSSFWKKRIIRLFPSMFFASIIIFTFFLIFDFTNFSFSQKILDFITSITFIKPTLINNLFDSFFGIQLKLNYLNGSFWSLWVEIQFYLLASIVFFLNRLSFIRNIVFTSFFLVFFNLIAHNVGGSNILGLPYPKEFSLFYSKWFDDGFNLFNMLPFFTIGILFYLMFKNKKANKKNTLFVKIAFILLVSFVFFFSKNIEEKLCFLMMFILFFIFIYYPNKLNVLDTKFFRKNGEASYFLYLIHESIGVFIIVALGNYFLPYGFVLPVLLILLFAYLSILYYDRIDLKVNKYLKNKFINK